MAKQATSKHINRVKYVLIDVVEFTREDRTIEDWLEIIAVMNRIVLSGIEELGLSRKQVILLPTGDGMFACILREKPHDVHIQLALYIQHLVNLHNASTNEVGMRFQLRVAVNEHNDLIIRDINRKRNVAGPGVNLTARIIAKCPPGGIIVSQRIYHETCKFKEYSKRYTEVVVNDKHGKEYLAYLLAPDPNEPMSLISLVGKVKGRMGPELTMADINALQVGSLVYHKVDGLGRVIGIGPPLRDGQKRMIMIRFKDNEHDIAMNNATGNYLKWLY